MCTKNYYRYGRLNKRDANKYTNDFSFVHKYGNDLLHRVFQFSLVQKRKYNRLKEVAVHAAFLFAIK